MGICNKVAGAIAPMILIQSITNGPDEIDQIQKQLKIVGEGARQIILNQLGTRLIIPYILMAVIFMGLGLMIRLSHLPDVDTGEDDKNVPDENIGKTSIFQFPYLLLGAIAVFCSASVEVLAVDSIINYAQHQGYSFRDAKFFATYTLIIMILSYLIGIIMIPRFVKQRKVLQICAVAGLIGTAAVILVDGKTSVWFVSFLGLFNALLWPTIWPLAIDGLGKFMKKGSALLIMGIVGGALTPLLYGAMSDVFSPQNAYAVLIPFYCFLFYYGFKGYKAGKVILSGH